MTDRSFWSEAQYSKNPKKLAAALLFLSLLRLIRRRKPRGAAPFSRLIHSQISTNSPHTPLYTDLIRAAQNHHLLLHCFIPPSTTTKEEITRKEATENSENTTQEEYNNTEAKDNSEEDNNKKFGHTHNRGEKHKP